jgi:hypothetical protein
MTCTDQMWYVVRYLTTNSVVSGPGEGTTTTTPSGAPGMAATMWPAHPFWIKWGRGRFQVNVFGHGIWLCFASGMEKPQRHEIILLAKVLKGYI